MPQGYQYGVRVDVGRGQHLIAEHGFEYEPRAAPLKPEAVPGATAGKPRHGADTPRREFVNGLVFDAAVQAELVYFLAGGVRDTRFRAERPARDFQPRQARTAFVATYLERPRPKFRRAYRVGGQPGEGVEKRADALLFQRRTETAWEQFPRRNQGAVFVVGDASAL